MIPEEEPEFWRGIPIENLDKETLINALKHVWVMYATASNSNVELYKYVARCKFNTIPKDEYLTWLTVGCAVGFLIGVTV